MNRFTKLFYNLSLFSFTLLVIAGCTGKKDYQGSEELGGIQSTVDGSKFDALQGCASEALANEKLCHLVPVEGEGSIEIGGLPFPKGILKNTFNDEGRLTQSRLYHELKPEVAMIVTDLDYDDQGRIENKKVSTDFNLDSSIDIVDKTFFTYLDTQHYEESGVRSFPSLPSKPTESLQNSYEDVSYTAIGLDPVTGEINYKKEDEVLTVRRRVNGSLLIVDDFTVTSTNGILESSQYRITDCVAKGNCAPTGKGPDQASAVVTAQLDVPHGELRGVEFGVDADANGDTTGPLDNVLKCKIRYALGESAPMLHFPEELKKLGFSGNRVPEEMSCTDKFNNESHLSWTWKPLWEALGVAQPTVN